jgi:hypothetical protein
MIIVYILRLCENKFYIDSIDVDKYANQIEEITKNIQIHIDGYDIEWTRLYKPIGIYQIYKNCNIEDENKYTKIMMSKYGIDNVRGGIYKDLKLTETEMIILMNEIIESEKDGENWCCSICDRDFEEEYELMEHEYICKKNLNICYRCNKKGHYDSDCIERTKIRG